MPLKRFCNKTVRWLFGLCVAVVMWKSGCMICVSGRRYEQSKNMTMAEGAQRRHEAVDARNIYG